MSYSVLADCTNCGCQWNPDIPKGKTRVAWAKSAVCPKCGITGNISTSVK